MTKQFGLAHIISIHALRVEGDPDLYIMQRGGWISIHALRVEGDRTPVNRRKTHKVFLSTPSGWRATAPHVICFCIQ